MVQKMHLISEKKDVSSNGQVVTMSRLIIVQKIYPEEFWQLKIILQLL